MLFSDILSTYFGIGVSTGHPPWVQTLPPQFPLGNRRPTFINTFPVIARTYTRTGSSLIWEWKLIYKVTKFTFSMYEWKQYPSSMHLSVVSLIGRCGYSIPYLSGRCCFC